MSMLVTSCSANEIWSADFIPRDLYRRLRATPDLRIIPGRRCATCRSRPDVTSEERARRRGSGYFGASSCAKSVPSGDALPTFT